MRIKFAITCLIVVFLSSCSPYDKVMKSNDYTVKLAKANEYFESKKWFRAAELYAAVLPIYKATPQYEGIYFNYCQTLFNLGDYLTSSYQFKSFVEAFPRSPKADEAEYMYALSLYKDSPRPSLDPSSTIKAREALVNYVNTHPGSPHTTEALKYIDECTDKLETKDLNAAILYYNMGQYRASKIAFYEMTVVYPESVNSDYYTFMTFKSSVLYADESIKSKQEERYVDAIAVYTNLKNYYPTSTYLEDADKLHESANKNIKNLRNEHQ